MNCSQTTKSGNPCKGTAKKDGLCIAHQPRTPKAESVESSTTVGAALVGGAGKPAFLKGMRRSRTPRFGQRRIKMLRPICDTCQAGEALYGWWLECPHDPYVSVRPVETQTPVYGEADDTGAKVVLEMQTTHNWIPQPNLVQVTIANSINSGNGEQYAREKGYIGLTELVSPVFPNGVAPMCEFRNCFWQHDLSEYRDGVFCRDIEAKRVSQTFTNKDPQGSARYRAIELLHPGKAQEQLEKVAIR